MDALAQTESSTVIDIDEVLRKTRNRIPVAPHVDTRVFLEESRKTFGIQYRQGT